MTSNWERLVGACVDGKYSLERCLSSEEGSATFLTDLTGETARLAAVKLVGSETPASADLLSRWNMAVALSHPHLVKLIAAGQTQIQDVPAIYAVMEYSEDNLTSVLRERPLTEDEAVDVIESTTSVLEYLHGRKLAHGHIKPSNIMSVGETIKISCDGLSRDGDGSASPADVYALGLTIVEMFTQQRPSMDAARGPQQLDLTRIPARFHEMVLGCLLSSPAARWTVARIRESLMPAVPTIASSAEPKTRQPVNRKWLYASVGIFGVLLTVVLALVLARNVDHSSPPAAVRPAPAPTAPAPASSPSPARTVAAEPVHRLSHGNWRLVAYTYNKLDHATRKKNEINRRWPAFKAEVFSLQSNLPPFLVTLGGPMAREDALGLRSQALRAGLPKDMYVQNYSR